MSIEIVLGFFFLVYYFVIFHLLLGFSKIKPFYISNLPSKTTFSIVVPFRNEKENLISLLDSISKLNYPTHLFEVILIDDFSDDGFQVPNCLFPIQVLKNAKKAISPKKEAIEKAIQCATNQWIITTDADCIVPKNWLNAFDESIQNNSYEMLAAPVQFQSGAGFLSAFQTLDFLSLQAATVGSFGTKTPFMCNGANFAYTKKFFHSINGFSGNETIASGDDVFLLQKAVAACPEKVAFLLANDAVVTTELKKNWSDLFQQRLRWASKTSEFSSFYGKMLAVVVFFGNLAVLISVFLVVFNAFPIYLVIFYLALKIIIDSILLFKMASFLSIKMHYFLLSSFFYPFFTVFIALNVPFRSYTWKGRSYEK